MITKHEFLEVALSFPGTEEKPHFERTGFGIPGRRMFSTYLEKDHTANIFLTPAEQKQFCKLDKKHIFPVPNAWGKKGATTFRLNELDLGVVQEALRSAYDTIANKSGKKRR